MKNKRIITVFIFSLFFCNIYAQEMKNDNVKQNELDKQNEEQTVKTKFTDKLDIIFEFTPVFYLSPECKEINSNTINLFYSITMGLAFPNDFLVSFQPTLSIFTMHHSLFNDMAVPIELENRTASTVSLMLNLPALFNLKLKKSAFHFLIGAGTFIRFGYLSKGLEASDNGISGNAADDVKIINNWFWKNAHWLYITAGTSWVYSVTPKIQIGPVVNIYLPIAEMIEYKSAQDLIFSVGIKLCI